MVLFTRGKGCHDNTTRTHDQANRHGPHLFKKPSCLDPSQKDSKAAWHTNVMSCCTAAENMYGSKLDVWLITTTFGPETFSR
mmetsp:Transcript_892/g.1796  ORF Transcript_892/g.1796 Transcript_892/m.1796 type:complete len:82 (+) Transcript_892:782-1027(+)